MIIDQFKLDHLVEKNNECAIYRATNNDDQKFMVLQINREPLIRMNHYKCHFQSELTFLFTNTPKPNKIKFINTLMYHSHQSTKYIKQIIITILYSLTVFKGHSNVNNPTYHSNGIYLFRAFLQAFTLYDIYFDAFQSKQITDRDFSIRRLFWSNSNLTLIDFGFSLFQKAHKPLSWSVKLGNLYNQIAGPNQNPKVRRIIQLLLSNKIQWTLIKDNLNQAFDYISKQLEPQDPMEISITDQPIKLTQSRGFQRSINAPSLTQTRVIKQGNLNLKDHFEKIKKSLSPGLSNRMPQILRPILESQRQSPISTYSRRSAMQNRQFLLNKPIENQFEYTIPNRSQSRELDQQQYNHTHTQQSRSQPNQGRVQKSYTQYDGAQQNPVQIVENSSYMPTIMEKQPISAQRRPQTSQPVKNEETPVRNNRMKTLLRTSTRELQQSDSQRENQQHFGRGASEETPVVKKQTETVTLTLKKPPSRRNSIDRGSARSIQNIELQGSNNSPNVKEYTNKLKMPKQQITQGYQSDEIDDLKQYSNKNKSKITMQQINQQIQQHTYQITSLDVQEVSNKKPIIVEQDISEIKLISHKQDSHQKKAVQIQNVSVQAFKIDQIDDNQILYHVQMEHQIKKYDIIGRMVAVFINHFQAKKNFWIIPLFLCFKRMAAFRLQLYDAIANEDYFLDIDLNVARKQELVRDFLVRIGQENKIVKKELVTLFQICEQTWKKFNQDEFAKIEKYMNMDMQQDIKDIYFVYLYTQIYKTVQSQYTKITNDEQKQKDNLKLQANALVSLIISEMPFNNNEDDTFSFTEHQNIGEHNLQEMLKYVKKLEVKVVQLKSRLNQKGIKI